MWYLKQTLFTPCLFTGHTHIERSLIFIENEIYLAFGHT